MKGVSYFNCKAKHGLFVLATKLAPEEPSETAPMISSPARRREAHKNATRIPLSSSGGSGLQNTVEQHAVGDLLPPGMDLNGTFRHGGQRAQRDNGQRAQQHLAAAATGEVARGLMAERDAALAKVEEATRQASAWQVRGPPRVRTPARARASAVRGILAPLPPMLDRS